MLFNKLFPLSSSLVKELAHFGVDVSAMVPPNVNAALRIRLVKE